MSEMINLIKKKIISFFIITCFNKKKYGHLTTSVGKYLLKLLPKISIKWACGVSLIPVKHNLRWLLRSRLGYHEKTYEFFMTENLKTDSVVIDVGSQVGLTACIASKISYDGHVHCFEPDKYNFTILTHAAKLNNLKNITLNNYALSDSNENKYFERKFHSGLNQSIKNKNSVLIKTTKLDDYVFENNLSKVDFIKIDVDGPDLRVLIGSEKTIKNFKPIIVFEVSRFWSDHNDSVLDAIKFMERYKYSLYSNLRNNDLTPIRINKNDISDIDIMKPGYAINVFCLPSS